MAYITINDLGEISALPADMLAAIDTATANAACDAATADANGYLGSRYALPITPGADVKQRVADIAAYRLASRCGYATGSDDTDFRQRYDDAIAWLKDVARGLVTPDVVTNAPAATFYATVRSAEPRGW